MRLWPLHPCYLATKGLLAFWRENLLGPEKLLGPESLPTQGLGDKCSGSGWLVQVGGTVPHEAANRSGQAKCVMLVGHAFFAGSLHDKST